MKSQREKRTEAEERQAVHDLLNLQQKLSLLPKAGKSTKEIARLKRLITDSQKRP